MKSLRFGKAILSGTDIVVNEACKGVVEKINWVGVSTQGANPTPDAPQTIYNAGDSGYVNVWSHKKNICFTDISNWESGDYFNENGIKVVNVNRVRLKELLRVNESTVYYLNLFPTTASYVWLVRAYDKNKVFVRSIGVIENGAAVTLASTDKYLGIVIYNSAGIATDFTAYTTLFNNGSIKPFICLNTETNKAYEPYTGSTTDITLPVKNLFDTNNLVTNYRNTIVSSSNNTLSIKPTLSGVCFTEYSIPVSPNTTYTLSRLINITPSGTPSGTGVIYIYFYNGSTYTYNTNLLNNGVSKTFTTGSTTKAIKLGFYSLDTTFADYANVQVDFTNIQFELGGATTYEPYVGYIGGSLPNGVADTDLQKKIGKVVLNGSEAYSANGEFSQNWTAWPSGTNTVAFYLGVRALKADVETIIRGRCDKFVEVARSSGGTGFANNDQEGTTIGGTVPLITGTPYLGIRILKSRLVTPDLAGFKTWLASNNVTVYYELATPTDITITKPQIPTYEGINTITTTNNIKPSLAIEAWKR